MVTQPLAKIIKAKSAPNKYGFLTIRSPFLLNFNLLATRDLTTTIITDFNILSSFPVKSGNKKGRFFLLHWKINGFKAALATTIKKGKGKFYWPLFLGIACPLVVYPSPLSKYNISLTGISSSPVFLTIQTSLLFLILRETWTGFSAPLSCPTAPDN